MIPTLSSRRTRGLFGFSEGFTLIESLVALSILAAMTAVTAPSLIRSVERARFNGAVREVANALKATRLQALASQEDAIFVLDLRARRYEAPDRGGILAIPGDATVSLITAQTEQTDEATAAIRFFPDGSSSGGSVRLVYGDTEAAVTVDWLTGHVTIGEKPRS